MKTKRAAIYLRVSTDEQTTENQRQALVEVAARRGWTVVETYQDQGVSGSKGRDQRPGFDRMLKDASRRRFDVLAVWSIDRLGRSTAAVATALDDLEAAGVAIYADKEGVDASTAHGRAMLEMASVFARLERSMIVERVKAGMARAKAEGRHVGRPRTDEDTVAAIRARLGAGQGIISTAKALGVGVGTVHRLAQEMKASTAAA
jgi:DNA invertase Pin-like site-specific DNA recombinase